MTDIDQETIARVAAAIDAADVGYSMTLIRLVDGVHTLRLVVDGKTEDFVDKDEEDASQQARARLRSIKLRKQAEAVIAALSTQPSPRPQEYTPDLSTHVRHLNVSYATSEALGNLRIFDAGIAKGLEAAAKFIERQTQPPQTRAMGTEESE